MADRGRPTDYRSEFCDRVVEWGRQGKSRGWMASQLDVSHQTILTWESKHADFLEAMERAQAHAQAHWEDLGHDNIKLRDFNSSVWSRSMAARFPKHWREKTAIVGGDADDRPVQQEIALGADAFTRAIAGLAARSGEGGPSGSDT
jgi:orotate phosphoribosyltransferase-like protein